MESENIAAALLRVHSIHADVEVLRRSVNAEKLSVSDRQYLERCFDLLEMELVALQQYLGGLNQEL